MASGNELRFFRFFGSMGMALLCLLPVAALAEICPASTFDPDYAPGGLVVRIVHCVQWTLLGNPSVGLPGVVNSFLIPFSRALANTVAATCTLAVMLFGLKMIIGGHQRLSGDGVVLAIKIAVVMLFSYNFGNMFPALLAIMGDMMNAVSVYIPWSSSCSGDVWQNMDCALDRLLGGILPGSTLTGGVLGILASFIFAVSVQMPWVGAAVGLPLAMMGGWMVLFLIQAMFKAVYTYLNAIIGLTFMAIISPIMVPCLLFPATRLQFDKWLRLLFGLMLQPIFLVAYVSMLLIAFEAVVFSGPQSLFTAIAGNYSTAPNFRLGNYVAATGAYGEVKRLPLNMILNPGEQQRMLGQSSQTDTGAFGNQAMQRVDAATLQQQNQALANNNNAAEFYIPVNTINMDVLASFRNMDTMTYVINIVLALLQAAVMAYIFYTMQGMVPYLATTLSGGVAGGLASLPNLSQGYDNMFSGFKKRVPWGTDPDVQQAARANVPGVGDRG